MKVGHGRVAEKEQSGWITEIATSCQVMLILSKLKILPSSCGTYIALIWIIVIQ